MTSKEQYGLKQRILARSYGEQRAAWEDCHTDDRAVFCGTYDMLMKACEAMKAVDNNMIRVAFNAKFSEDEACLERISEVFKGKGDAL